MPYRVDFTNPATGKVITSSPIITNLGEAEIIKLAKEALIEDKLATEELLKPMKAQIRVTDI